MYHSISDMEEKVMHPYYQTSTSPEVFSTHMQYLYDNNYSVISLTEAVRLFSTTQPLNHSTTQPLNYVVITFDDGFRDFYTEALPTLKKYGFTATIFLPTSFIEQERLMFKNKECLTWDEVRDLRRKGFSFGSHSVTHRQLKSLSNDEVESELRQSKERIEENIKESSESFAYPYRFPEEDKKFCDRLRGILEKCGYKFGVSTRIGTTDQNDNIFFLKRIPVNSFDDTSLFEAKLQKGYDWMYAIQVYSKFVRHKILSNSE
jgi:peptidoglycan/xylan/chitin deacetylase (PgdA/CDA1 family)